MLQTPPKISPPEWLISHRNALNRVALLYGGPHIWGNRFSRKGNMTSRRHLYTYVRSENVLASMLPGFDRLPMKKKKRLRKYQCLPNLRS